MKANQRGDEEWGINCFGARVRMAWRACPLLAGSFCSPKCGPSSPCPADTHKGATAKGECVLQTPSSTSPSQCALICKPKPSGGDCPVGATCVPIQGLGICTYEPKAEAEAEDAAGTAEKQSEVMEVKN